MTYWNSLKEKYLVCCQQVCWSFNNVRPKQQNILPLNCWQWIYQHLVLTSVLAPHRCCLDMIESHNIMSAIKTELLFPLHMCPREFGWDCWCGPCFPSVQPLKFLGGEISWIPSVLVYVLLFVVGILLSLFVKLSPRMTSLLAFLLFHWLK